MLKIACLFNSNASASGGLCPLDPGLCPLDPLPGLCPWGLDTAGEFRPQTPCCVQCDVQTILGPG